MTIENKIMDNYASGRYCPIGADGGALRYISTIIDGKTVKASITLDSDIQAVRAVWELTIDKILIYDFTREYYKLRK